MLSKCIHFCIQIQKTSARTIIGAGAGPSLTKQADRPVGARPTPAYWAIDCSLFHDYSDISLGSWSESDAVN